MRVVKAVKSGVTETTRRGALLRCGDERGDAFYAAARVFESDDVWVLREFGYDLDGDFVVREFRNAVDDDGQRRTIGESAVVGKDFGAVIRIVAGRAREDGVVLLIGGIFGETESFRYALSRDSCEQNFVGRGGLARPYAGRGETHRH